MENQSEKKSETLYAPAFSKVFMNGEESDNLWAFQAERPLDLQEAQDRVGGIIEFVQIHPGHGDLCDDYLLVVNESGRLHNLEFNRAASELAGQRIVGPAFVVPKKRIE